MTQMQFIESGLPHIATRASGNFSLGRTATFYPTIACTLIAAVAPAIAVSDDPVFAPVYANSRVLTDWIPATPGLTLADEAEPIEDLISKYRGALTPGSFTHADIEALRGEWA